MPINKDMIFFEFSIGNQDFLTGWATGRTGVYKVDRTCLRKKGMACWREE